MFLQRNFQLLNLLVMYKSGVSCSFLFGLILFSTIGLPHFRQISSFIQFFLNLFMVLSLLHTYFLQKENKNKRLFESLQTQLIT